MGSCHPVREELELQSQVQMSLLLWHGTCGWTVAMEWGEDKSGSLRSLMHHWHVHAGSPRWFS